MQAQLEEAALDTVRPFWRRKKAGVGSVSDVLTF
jgi:hypothetical protein